MVYPAHDAVMLVHGPEIFDSGDAAHLMDMLCPLRTIVAGVMGRTAAEESGLPAEFDGRPPSRVILDLSEPVFLVNRGKTAESGEIFGGIVASRLAGRGLVHVECSSRTVYCWDNGDPKRARAIAERMDFEVKLVKSPPQPAGRIRRIRGCIPGEAVYVNGIVIGVATSTSVEIQTRDGSIIPVSGLQPKMHGIEKFGREGTIDISTAWCKSGHIRTQAPRADGKAPKTGRVLTIDHCGHEIYARMPADCCGVLAIGDDTTSVCGHICTHRGIPVLGIIDGDRDTIVPSAFAPGSVVVETQGERDDDVGKEIAGKVPDVQVVWDDWVRGILAYLHKRVRVVIDLREDA